MKNKILPATQHVRSFVREWLMIPHNRGFAVLLVLFAVSLSFWIASGPKAESVLFFASRSGNGLRGESRALPHEPGIEKTAATIVSELLIGPRDRGSKPLFDSGTRLESLIYRQGTLYIDLSPAAAIGIDPPLSLGIKALKKSIQSGIPGFRKIVVTVGGQEPLRINKH